MLAVARAQSAQNGGDSALKRSIASEVWRAFLDEMQHALPEVGELEAFDGCRLLEAPRC